MGDFNLLRRRKKSQAKTAYWFKVQMVAFLLVVGLIMSGWHLILQQRMTATVKQFNSLQKELNSLAGKTQGDSISDKQHIIWREITDKITSLEQQRANFILTLKAIEQGVSRSLYLTHLTIKKQEITISGCTRCLSDLELLAAKLGQIKLCQTLIVNQIDRKEDDYNFVLSCGRQME